MPKFDRVGAGRPSMYNEPLVRVSVSLPKDLVDAAINAGEGNVSRGIRSMLVGSDSPPQKTAPATVTSIKRSVRPVKSYDDTMRGYFAARGISKPSLASVMKYKQDHPE